LIYDHVGNLKEDKRYNMKVSDYVIQFIKSLGVDKVFCVTGGGAMHLNNSLGCSKEVEGVFMLHEQGASIAAEAYARIREGYGVCLVTSGPGGTNAITGLCGAYMDSIPVIFISGQAKRADLVGNQNIRQFGIQEVDIISIVRPYTKYAVQISDENRIKYELEKAAYMAVEGRPGAVWIDIPLDIQATDVDVDSLDGFIEKPLKKYPSYNEVMKVIEEFNKANRPAIMLGNGVRLAHAVEKSHELLNLLKAPAFVSWNGVDIIDNENPLFYGRPNVVGDRAANLILQNADFVLTIGTRLSLLNSGYNYADYLKNAFHVMVDIDSNEMEKKSLHPQLKIVSDAGTFIDMVLENKDKIVHSNMDSWIDHCNEIRNKYPAMIPEQEPGKNFVSLYRLFETLSDTMTSEDIYQFTSSGTSVDIGMKSLRLKKNQRAFLNKSMAAMGYDVPASIGSCLGSGKKRTICVTGDGSIAMNMQELEVIKRYNLPIKIFVADNNGYSMIYQSQNGNFKGNLTGCTEESGLTLPNMNKIAKAFGIFDVEITDESQLIEKVNMVLEHDGPVICRVKTDICQKILPKQSNFMNKFGQMESRPLHDMVPLLDRDELEQCMNWK
jgi:acetolactate synthase-1/2/3 large subunit